MYLRSVKILRLFNLPSGFTAVSAKRVLVGIWTKAVTQCRLYYSLLRLKEDTGIKEHDFCGPGPALFSVR